MHVTTHPIDEPVVLYAQPYEDQHGKPQCVRVLVFREGVLAKPVLNLLGKLLREL